MLTRRSPNRSGMQFANPFDWFFDEPWYGRGQDLTSSVPAIDLREQDDAFIVDAEMPGVRPEDADVTLDGRMLIIRGRYGTNHQDQSGRQGQAQSAQHETQGQPGQTGENQDAGQGRSQNQGQGQGQMQGQAQTQARMQSQGQGQTDGGRGRYLVRERQSGEFVRAITLPADIDADKVTCTFMNGELNVTLPKAQQARSRRIPISGGAENARRIGGSSDQAPSSSQS